MLSQLQYTNYTKNVACSFSVWPLLPTHCSCRGLSLHRIIDTHIYLVGLPWTKDRPPAETSTSQHTKLTTEKHTWAPAVFEPVISACERPQTYALDRAATGTGSSCIYKQSQWPRGLRRGSTTARLLRLRVRIPPEAWMFVCRVCCDLCR